MFLSMVNIPFPESPVINGDQMRFLSEIAKTMSGYEHETHELEENTTNVPFVAVNFYVSIR